MKNKDSKRLGELYEHIQKIQKEQVTAPSKPATKPLTKPATQPGPGKVNPNPFAPRPGKAPGVMPQPKASLKNISSALKSKIRKFIGV